MTLKELADRLDVSVSAISLAINGKPGLSDETRSRILAEVESVGYPLKERAEQFTKKFSCYSARIPAVRVLAATQFSLEARSKTPC